MIVAQLIVVAAQEREQVLELLALALPVSARSGIPYSGTADAADVPGEVGDERSVLSLTVDGEEEELPIAHEREPDSCPELMLLVDVRRHAEGIVRRQTAAAKEVMTRAANFVRARLRDHVQKTARRAPELRRKAVGDDLELLHRVERDGEILGLQGAEELAEEIVVGVGAVDDEPGVVALLAAEPDAAAETGYDLGRRAELREVAIVAAGQGQIGDGLLVDELTDPDGGRVDDARRPRPP